MTIFNSKNQVLVKSKPASKFLSNKKLSIIAIVLFILVVPYTFYKINQFFENNKFVFQTPIKVALETPVYVTKRAVPFTIVKEVKAEENVSPLTPDQQYLCNLFGKDCVTALAIMRAESGMSNKAINVNKDGSVDFGCMQINSVHFKTIDVSKVNLLNCQDNIDVAYKMFKQQGNFSAWSAYNNGAYKKYLIN